MTIFLPEVYAFLRPLRMNPYCIAGLGQRACECDDVLSVLVTTTADIRARKSTRYSFILLVSFEVKLV